MLTDANISGAFVRFSSVTIYNPYDILLVRNLDLMVRLGNNVLVSGPNGCGKTSLFRCLSGLWKPRYGQIVVSGLQMSSAAARNSMSRDVPNPSPGGRPHRPVIHANSFLRDAFGSQTSSVFDFESPGDRADLNNELGLNTSPELPESAVKLTDKTLMDRASRQTITPTQTSLNTEKTDGRTQKNPIQQLSVLKGSGVSLMQPMANRNKLSPDLSPADLSPGDEQRSRNVDNYNILDPKRRMGSVSEEDTVLSTSNVNYTIDFNSIGNLSTHGRPHSLARQRTIVSASHLTLGDGSSATSSDAGEDDHGSMEIGDFQIDDQTIEFEPAQSRQSQTAANRKTITPKKQLTRQPSDFVRAATFLGKVFGGTTAGEKTSHNPASRRSQIFYLPQSPYICVGSLYDNVWYPAQRSDDAESEQASRERIIRLLTQVGLESHLTRLDDLTHDWNSTLSGGERQKLSFARVLFHEPDFAALDEATSAVSQDVQENLYSLLQQSRVTYFSIAHRPEIRKFHQTEIKIFGDGAGGWAESEIKTGGSSKASSVSVSKVT